MSSHLPVLNLFYEELDPDRWIRFDRYPRRMIRRIVRGRGLLRGQTKVFLNLCAGLDRLGIRYRVNDYAHMRRHPGELACILGKPHILDKLAWKNPILLGSAIYSHPLDDPTLLQRRPIAKVLVPGPWMKAMCEPHWGAAVAAWPVGIDTAAWQPSPPDAKTIDVLLYDKVMWDHDRREAALLEPIRAHLRQQGRSFTEMRYGHYREQDFRALLAEARAMIFLCEHETQGIAYQQALSCGVPILAWDLGGHWKDPFYYPDRVVFGPVSSTPYWDERCGMHFADLDQFIDRFAAFWEEVQRGGYAPRDFVLEGLTLERCAQAYVDIARGLAG